MRTITLLIFTVWLAAAWTLDRATCSGALHIITAAPALVLQEASQ